MAVAELHEAGKHYLFNTDCVDSDPTLFGYRAQDSVSTDQQGRGTVYFKTIHSRGQPLNIVIKQYQRGGMIRFINRNLYLHWHYQNTRVWREFQLLLTLKGMDLPVPQPVAGLAQMKFPGCYTLTIITREIEQSMTLADYLRQPATDKTTDRKTDALWHQTGVVIGRFHRANVYHADLNASNILITDGGDVYLIDFDNGAIKDTPKNTLPTAHTNWQTDNLQRLQRSLLKYRNSSDQFSYTESNWNIFLEGYRSSAAARTVS